MREEFLCHVSDCGGEGIYGSQRSRRGAAGEAIGDGSQGGSQASRSGSRRAAAMLVGRMIVTQKVFDHLRGREEHVRGRFVTLCR